MPITRDFKLPLTARARRDPAFAQALLDETSDLVRNDELATAQLILSSVGIAPAQDESGGSFQPS